MDSYFAVIEFTGGPGLGCFAGDFLGSWDGFIASYLAVTELTGGPGLSCFAGDFLGSWDGFIASYLAVTELTGGTGPGCGETLRAVGGEGGLLGAGLLDD